MSITTIYYRGLLKSCNYRCSYCPFSKNPHSEKQIAADREALERFCRQTEKADDLGIMFLPYGEALIHAYYLEQIGRLTGMDHIRFVACQTNLSFEVEDLARYKIEPGKLKLWCSFHPSQTTIDQFVSQCRKLKAYGASFSVGAVGDPEALPVIRELRARLDPHIYLWINDMDGRRERYTEAEIAAFSRIDPLFPLELQKQPADTGKCKAGRDSVFINGKGDVYACNISKVLLGNFYKQGLEQIRASSCRAKTCSCYLAYSNRTDLEILSLTGDNRTVRIPDHRPWHPDAGADLSGIRAFFFDVDGTLTDETGHISEANQEAVRELAKTCRIYLATSLPYREAYRRCKGIWDCLNGGAFAEGSDIRIFNSGYDETIPLKDDLIPAGCGSRIRVYHKKGILHKISVPEADCEHIPEGVHAVYEDGRVGITDQKADKLRAVLRICREMGYGDQEVAVYGNSGNDVEMIKYFKHSFAVESSSEEVRAAAGEVRDIGRLIKITPV